MAGLLVPASTARIGAALGALLLAAFSAAIGMALSQGKQPNCNCFGRLTRSPVSARTIARDLVLAARRCSLLSPARKAALRAWPR